MQSQFLFLFLSWAVQEERMAKSKKASSRWEGAGGAGRGERSLRLVVVAGSGGPAPYVTSELFYQLRILLLPLLDTLLACLDETGQSFCEGHVPGALRRLWLHNLPGHELLNLGVVH